MKFLIKACKVQIAMSTLAASQILTDAWVPAHRPPPTLFRTKRKPHVQNFYLKPSLKA